MRKYITPGSVRIYGLPGTDESFGLRDNGAGQMWSMNKRVGSINYWTGEVVLDKKYVPKFGFWSELKSILKLKRGDSPDISCEYEVSVLDVEGKQEPAFTGLKYPFVTGR
jgi:hypothetical protein